MSRVKKVKVKAEAKGKSKRTSAKPKAASKAREAPWLAPRRYRYARVGSTLSQVVEFIAKHPRFTTNELRAALRKGRNLLGMPLCGLTRRGLLTRTGRGTYLCLKVSALPEVREAA